MRLSLFALKQCIIKQLLDSVFVISEIIKVSVSVISLSLRLRLITLTSTLIISDITKTSSNNCLLFQKNQKQIDSMLLSVYLVVDHRRRQNVLRTVVTLLCHFCLCLLHSDVICDQLLNRHTAKWNLLVQLNRCLVVRNHDSTERNHFYLVQFLS